MNTLLKILSLASTLGITATAGASVFSLTFDSAESIDDWTVAGDSFNETSKTWLATGGNPGGALEFGGYHNGTGAGRGYSLNYSATGLDLSQVTELSFDAILTGPIDGTNIQLQVLFDGVALFPQPGGFISLNAPGPLNSVTWEKYSYDLSAVDPGATSVSITFLVAAGAFAGAGATMAIDNVTVVPEPSTYAAFFGLVALGVIIVRRRRA